MAAGPQPRPRRDIAPTSPEASSSWRGSRGARDMTEASVTSSLGPMGPLLGRLHSLLDADIHLPHHVNKVDLRQFTSDLEEVGTSIMELTKAEDPNLTDKCWMKEVRELSFDTEDFLDTVLPSGSRVSRKPRIRTKMKRRKRPLQIAKDISELRSRLQEATERRERYQPGVVQTFTPTKKKFIGLDKPMEDLVTMLDFDRTEKLMVVSITGFPGVGKTTIATKLYHLYGGRFHCKAYLRASRKPDTRRLLASLISQLTRSESRATPDVHDLITNIRDHLQGKSYFIIVDDLWAPSVWDTIRRAFPDDNCCSRIVTTTQIEDVALACCRYDLEHIFKLRPLNDNDSRSLFLSIVGASENDSFDPQFPYSIVSKCGGLPFAITSVASMLVSWPNAAMEHLTYIQDSLCCNLGSSPTSGEMKKVMNLVYNDLPAQLKTCLLYLNIYPEDSVILKDDLVKQWLAEGFLSAVKQHDMDIVARSYFDQLVTRGMIQPVDTNCNDEVLSFTVHHVVLDLIAYECMDENFITVVDCSETSGVPDKIRRLSVKFGGAKNTHIPSRMRVSQVRSLTFSGFFKCVPSIVEYQLLRVLILRIWTDEDKKTLDLSSISELNQMRYLKIECSMIVKFPAKIEGLQHLETLDVNARVASVPSDIVHLQQLLHLHLPAETSLPQRIGYMTSLRSLGYFNLSSNSKHNVLGLGKLTGLSDLRMTYSMERPDRAVSNMKHVAEIVGKMDNLKSLILESYSSKKQNHANPLGENHPGGAFPISDISRDSLTGVSSRLALLERLELSPRICTFLGIPDWVNEFSKLCILKIALQSLSSDDVVVLRRMTALASLSLYVQTAPEESIIIQNEGFSVLKHFKFVSSALCLAFVDGAMPSVQLLKLRLNATKIVQDSLLYAGIEHLASLLEISAKIGGANAYEPKRKAIQSALEVAFNKNKIHPIIINIKVVDKCYYVEKDMSKMPQTEEHQTQELQVIRKKGSTGQPRTEENDPTMDTGGQAANKIDVPLQSSSDATHSGPHAIAEIPWTFPATTEQNSTTESPRTSYRLMMELRKYIVLLASLVATVTYAAGFSPPGDVWKDTAAGHIGGDPILRDTNHIRYLVFYYCNSTAFAASLVINVLVFSLSQASLDKKDNISSKFMRMMVDRLKNSPTIAVQPLQVVMVLDLLSLMGAYAASTCRDKFTIIYSSVLMGYALFCIVLQVAVASYFSNTGSGSMPEGQVEERQPVPDYGLASAAGGNPNSGSGCVVTEPEVKEQEGQKAKKRFRKIHMVMAALDSVLGNNPQSSSGSVVPNKVEQDKAKERFRKVLMLLATFTVSITYLAGLSTPGGFWDSAGDGHRPGVAILMDHDGTRLKVFFGFNTLAFVASLLFIVLVLNTKLHKSTAYGYIVVILLSIMGAYNAGSCRQTDTTVYVFSLIPAVLVYISFLYFAGDHIYAKWKAMIKRFRKEPLALAPNPTHKEKAANKARSYFLLLATLTATITYQAGLDPPGSVWQDNSGGHMAGDPILWTKNARRYNAFFYCNSVSLVASLVAVVLIQKKLLLNYNMPDAVMILDLLGLIGAYVAGSCRDVLTSIYAMALAGGVLFYMVLRMILFTLDTDKQTRTESDKEKDNALVEKTRKWLLLFAILLATITYQAGLTPPGGFLLQDDDLSGHDAGNPVLLYNFPRRYSAFFYCNSVSFMISISLIIVLINRNLYRPAIRTHALSVCTVAGLFGLMGAYAAGSTNHLKTSVYTFVLQAMVIFFMVLLFLVFRFTCNTKSTTTTQLLGAGVEPNTQDETATTIKGMHAKPKYLMLFGILVASVTYKAGLEPPGGFWKTSSGGYKAGNPIMHDIRRPRYLVFFYWNSFSFMASIVIILLPLVPEKLLGKHRAWLRRWLVVMNTTIVLDFLGLLVAYAAGSTRKLKTSVNFIILVYTIPGIVTTACLAIHLLLSKISKRSQSTQENTQLEQSSPV